MNPSDKFFCAHPWLAYCAFILMGGILARQAAYYAAKIVRKIYNQKSLPRAGEMYRHDGDENWPA